MIHQPYEDWLLANPGLLKDALSVEQAAALRDHLTVCEACRLLADALDGVETRLQAAPVVAPRSGFTSRWQARLAAERVRSHRRQSLGLLGLSATGAIVLFSLILASCWPLIKSPGLLALLALYQGGRLFMLLESSQRFLVEMLRSTGSSLPWVTWVLVVGIVSQLGVLWIVSYRILTNPRRISK